MKLYISIPADPVFDTDVDTFQKVFNDIKQIEAWRIVYPYLEKYIDFMAIGELLISFKYYHAVQVGMSDFYIKLTDQNQTVSLLECRNLIDEFNRVYIDLANLGKIVKRLPLDSHYRSQEVRFWSKNVSSAANCVADFKAVFDNQLAAIPDEDERRLRFTFLEELERSVRLSIEKHVHNFLQLIPFCFDILSLFISDLKSYVFKMREEFLVPNKFNSSPKLS